MGLIFMSALFIYFVFALFVTWKLSQLPKKDSHGLLVVILCVFVFAGLLVGDAVFGRLYVKYLCSGDGGVVINETVEIEPEYFDIDGKFVIDSDSFFKEGMLLKDRYRIVTKVIAIKGNVNKRVISITDVLDNKEIASLTYYSGGGGWIENISPGGGIKCPEYDVSTFQNIFFLKVFLTNKSS